MGSIYHVHQGYILEMFFHGTDNPVLVDPKFFVNIIFIKKLKYITTCIYTLKKTVNFIL